VGPLDSSQTLHFPSRWGDSMVTPEEFRETVMRMLKMMKDGLDLESAIIIMRREGFSPIDCIKGVTQLTGNSLADATKVVHCSIAWADVLGPNR
jgi:hypothetical protein